MKLFIPLFVYIYITKKAQLLLSLFYFKFMGYSVTHLIKIRYYGNSEINKRYYCYPDRWW